MSGTNLNIAHKQWATRPDDQRFLTLADLQNAVSNRKVHSWAIDQNTSDVRVVANGNSLGVETNNGVLTPTHWAFGQLAGVAGAPPNYLRTLPPDLAARNLQHGLENNAVRDKVKLLAHVNGNSNLRAVTSGTYGRIWDSEVVQAVIDVNERSGNVWKIPAASYSKTDPKRATTLYGSDRDVFIFLVDDEHPIEVAGETLWRGFFVWNSEVGAATFGMTKFLYRYVCDNRIIWGAEDVQTKKMRHTRLAPDRFVDEGQTTLKTYAQSSTASVEAGIKAAKAKEIAATEILASMWLMERGLSRKVAENAAHAAVAEEGGAGNLWQIIQGVTAYARTIPYTDERVDLEQQAGELMAYATN